MALAVAIGGMVGAAARYVLLRQWPPGPDDFPVTTLIINVVGCCVMGVFMAATDHLVGHRLIRPFFGTGVLGGFTTFSTFSGELEQLVNRGDARLAAAYLAASMLAALVAVAAGAAIARRTIAMAHSRSAP